MADELPTPGAEALPGETAIAPVTAAPVDPHQTPTLLETVGVEPVTPVVTPAEPVAVTESVTEAPKTEPVEAKVETPPEPVVETSAPEPVAIDWTFKLPETLAADTARIDSLKGILNDILSPREGQSREQRAQDLIGLHTQAMESYAEQVARQQMQVWNDTRADWRRQAMADEQIGGSGHLTAMSEVAQMRDLLVPAADRAAFDQFLRATGAGDHPAFLKVLHNAARYMREPAQPPSNIKPTADNGRNPNERRSAVLYDRSRSMPGR
jgi:hypothetical protein